MNFSFDNFVILPSEIGWRVSVAPAESPVAEYDFDVLIGADGKRNTLQGRTH